MACVICFNPIKNKYTLDCNHSFCFKCIDKWFKYNPVVRRNTCPICRTEGKIDNTKIRLTRSMTFENRTNNIFHQIQNLLTTQHETGGKTTLVKIYTILYDNQWFFKIEGILIKTIKDQLDKFERDGWKEASIWKYKFRHIL